MDLLALPAFLLIAALYSAVGHGGATGYLALMSFFNVPPHVMACTALTLNCLTAGISCFVYSRAGYLSPRLTLPFIVTSIPCAFLGAMVKLDERQYAVLLGSTLIVTAILLLLKRQKPIKSENKTISSSAESSSPPEKFVCSPPLPQAGLSGALLGFLSGAVGIGGGVFLSPLIILARWADTKSTSATAAVFIIANSASGLVGRALSGALEFGNVVPFLAAALIGAIAGSYWGAHRSTAGVLRIPLAIVLFIAALKMFLPK
ncbi:MAG: sulfite exporter TauE/SafE family protein [Candidatus Melainabacteria bacterium]|nr:sulfite exporter TauE/SafE family protein [Candidatus Melainabacteria bacterium]